MKLRVFLLPLLVLLTVPLLLETVHGRTTAGSRHQPPVVLLQLAAADAETAPPAQAAPMILTSLVSSGVVQDTVHQAPRDNLRAGQRYDILLRHSAWFRSLREGKECGAIDANDIKDSCRASFAKLEAWPAPAIHAALAR